MPALAVHGAHILAVDDVEENLDILVDALGTDYDVRVATDGLIALEMVSTDPPDLILLDLMLPGIDGLEVCKTLKSNEKTAHIPVIMVTAKAMIGEKMALNENVKRVASIASSTTML